MSSLWQNPDVFIVFFLFSIIISGDTASYFIKMFMLISLCLFILISLECTLAQTRMGFGRLTLPSRGAMMDQYVFLMAKF